MASLDLAEAREPSAPRWQTARRNCLNYG